MKVKNLVTCAALACGSLAAVIPSTAFAALYSTNFGSLVPGYAPNDDDSWSVSLPFSYTYFGATYTGMSINNNGNVTFGGSASAYSPNPLNTNPSFKMIAPFWTDLDSRGDPLGAISAGTGGSGVYFRQVNASEVLVTWDRLGIYPAGFGGNSGDYSGREQFQLVLRDPTSTIPAGQGSIGFFYAGMTAGSQANSRNVTAGFGDGLAAVNPGEVSLSEGTLGQVTSQLNGQAYWFDVDSQGVVVDPGPTPSPVPIPAAAWLMLSGIGALGAAARRRKAA